MERFLMADDSVKRILLIDDDIPLRTAFSRALERQGYTTKGIDGSVDVVDEVRNFEPSIVLMDNHMPGKTGMQILKILRGYWSIDELPVVLISGSSRQAEVDSALAQGVTAFRRKPLGIAELIETVRLVGSGAPVGGPLETGILGI